MIKLKLIILVLLLGLTLSSIVIGILKVISFRSDIKNNVVPMFSNPLPTLSPTPSLIDLPAKKSAEPSVLEKQIDNPTIQPVTVTPTTPYQRKLEEDDD